MLTIIFLAIFLIAEIDARREKKQSSVAARRS